MSALLVLSAPLASAGEPDAVEIPQKRSLWNWFVGGSGGYLLENEADFGALQAGVVLPFEFAGFRQSVYLEVGRFKAQSGTGWSYTETIPGNCYLWQPWPYCSEEQEFGESYKERTKLEVVSVTLNWAVERKFSETLSGYFGGGLGVAVVSADYSFVYTQFGSFGGGEGGGGWEDDSSDEDVVLYGQLFGGVTAHVSENLELFVGARAVFMGDPDVEAFGQDVGGQLSETDILIEAGARITF